MPASWGLTPANGFEPNRPWLTTPVAARRHGGWLQRRRPYGVLWMHGTEEAIGRDMLLKGTALCPGAATAIGLGLC